MLSAPKGLGVYARQLSVSSYGTPEALAKRLVGYGFSYIAFMACWQDKQGERKTFRQLDPDLVKLKEYVEACASAGLEIYLWGFPWIGHETEYVDAMTRVTKALNGRVRGWIHDPEVSYCAKGAKSSLAKGQGEANADYKPTETEARVKQAAALLVSLEATARAGLKITDVGYTSYGMASWHPLAWSEFGGHGWGSPQLYSVSAELVGQGLNSWRNAGWDHLIPSVPLYGTNSGTKLDEYLSFFLEHKPPVGHKPINGFIFWSLNQLGANERTTLQRFAEMLKKQQCV